MVNNVRINLERITIIYMAVFGILMLIYCSVNVPTPVGEWDDYSLPIASIIKEHNISISDVDVAYYKELFPNWAGYIESYRLSGYTTRAGGQMVWYFPIYALVCIPFVLILSWIKLPTIYAFPYTNLAVLMISVTILNRCLKSREKTKLFMVLLLTLNPIVFYISWTSGEVFIYSMLVMGLTFWYNRWYKRAAFFVSVAGMLNPTIMAIGIVMILEYVIVLLRTKAKEEKWSLFIKKKIPEVIKYGCCYIISIIPMAYNYYNVGHINLTASLSGFTSGNESTFSRFVSYVFDLNYGILPYFPLLLILSIVFFIVAIFKKNIRYIEWVITFLINMALYSVMIHINCEMSGISRYNSWGALILIFAVALIGTDSLTEIETRGASFIVIGIGVVFTTITVFVYGPTCASNTLYLRFTPIAEWTLDHFAKIYNPLKSTFNSRTVHVDGGYSYETPVTYSAKDGYIRKILASENDKEVLLNNYVSIYGTNENFINQVYDLNGVGYISLSAKDGIVRVEPYEAGNVLLFSANESTGLKYAVQGLSTAEEWGTWSIGHETKFRMKCDVQSGMLHCEIVAGVHNNVQDITISVNGQRVYQNHDYKGEGIQFDFANPGVGNCIEIAIEIPNAISPAELGVSDDRRVLGLGFTQMTISKAIITE